jgi:NAD(P)-dependent dehydrogenase (short-subunit alcohol dehydrogenase family)
MVPRAWPLRHWIEYLRGDALAVVTGAGSGLGRAIALDLAGRGYLIQATDVDAEAPPRPRPRSAPAPALGARRHATARPAGRSRRPRRHGLGRSTSGSTTPASSSTGLLGAGRATRRTMLDVNALGTMNGTVAALEQMMPAGRAT